MATNKKKSWDFLRETGTVHVRGTHTRQFTSAGSEEP